MTKIKLKPKSSAETEPYGAFVNMDYDNAIVEAELYLDKGKQCAYVLGEELIKIGVAPKTIILQGKYIIADFEIVEE